MKSPFAAILKKATIVLILSGSFVGTTLGSGVAHDLMAFFKSAGLASNVTRPGAYQDQTAGFYSGGSIVARNSVRNAQPATVQMPGFRAGCGGPCSATARAIWCRAGLWPGR